ncbi:hypothetical protein BH23BAC1_BH23BAC1_45320 [soil metagenome]
MDKEKIIIRALSPNDIPVMYEAFLLAFSDYAVNFNLSYEQFVNKFIHKLQINFRLSAGAFFGEQLIGFLFTSLGNYQNEYLAYNGGTGVIPEFRGRELTKRMYQYLLPGLLDEKVQKCCLEVITSNINAVKAYMSIGFRRTKLFHCFKLLPAQNQDLRSFSYNNIYPVANLDWNVVKTFADVSPSFLDSFDVLPGRLKNEKIIVSTENQQILGYAIYQPEIGRISQLAVKKEFRRKRIGTSLMAYIYDDSNEKNLTAINVQAEAKDLISYFKFLKFENQVDQYEMRLSLDRDKIIPKHCK